MKNPMPMASGMRPAAETAMTSRVETIQARATPKMMRPRPLEQRTMPVRRGVGEAAQRVS